MSWDATILRPKNPDVAALIESEDDLERTPMGTIRELGSLLEAVLTIEEWDSETDAYLTCGGASLKLSLETEMYLQLLEAAYGTEELDPDKEEEFLAYRSRPDEQVLQIRVEARHRGDPIDVLAMFCRTGGWMLLDYQTGLLLSPSDFTSARVLAKISPKRGTYEEKAWRACAGRFARGSGRLIGDAGRRRS